MKRLRRIALLPLAVVAGSLFAQERLDDSIFGALRISSLDDLASSAGAFADRIEPGSGANTAQLTSAASSLGFATDQEVLALLIDPQKSAQPYALVLPAVDPEKLKANPQFNFQPTAASPDRYQIKLPNGMPMFATFVGKRLVVSPLEAGLDAVLPVLKSDTDIRQLRAAGGQLALSLSTDRIYTAYKPMLDFMLMGMRSQFAKVQADKNPQAPNPADVLGSVLGTLADVQDYSLRIAIHADHLDLRNGITAKPGSTTAALFNAGRGPAVGVPAALDASASVFGTVSARPGPEFWAAYNQMSTGLLASMGNKDAATTQALTQTVNDFAGIWDGTAAFAFLSPAQGLSGGGSVGIKDQEKALSLIRRVPELQKTMASINAGQGLAPDVALGEEEKLGDSRLIDITQTYRALSPEMENSLKLLQKAGMEKIHGTYGVSPSRMHYVMGDNSRAETKRLLEAPSAATSAEISPAVYGLPAESTAFVAISLPRYLGWMSRIGGLPFTYDAASAPKAPGLAMTADLVDGRADIRVHLATSEIVAVKNSFAQPAPATPAPAAAVAE